MMVTTSSRTESNWDGGTGLLRVLWRWVSGVDWLCLSAPLPTCMVGEWELISMCLLSPVETLPSYTITQMHYSLCLGWLEEQKEGVFQQPESGCYLKQTPPKKVVCCLLFILVAKWSQASIPTLTWRGISEGFAGPASEATN